jgi:hypothetical protein
MKLTVRRIGNSLGVIIPRAALERWGVAEGDALELREDRIAPAASGLSKADLDELRLARAFAVVRQFSPREIRAKGLANLHRWKAKGAWTKAYEEWEAILADEDDGRLFAAMLGRDENAVRLRQSAPYVGLLPPDQVKAMNEKIAA